MITPIKALNIWDLMKRENDLLVSVDDIKAIAINERVKVIDDFYNGLATDLLWVREKYGEELYTDLWCAIGIRADKLKEDTYGYDK